jgi:WD40 repeat protein
VSGSADGAIRVWEPVTGQELLALKAHQGPVISLAIRAGDGALVSADDDGTMKVWSASIRANSAAPPTIGVAVAVPESVRRPGAVAANLNRLALALVDRAEWQQGKMDRAVRAKFPGQQFGTGKPLLSWRVAILPIIGQMDLYKQFHLDEPWDSPHNIKLLDKMPDVFAIDPKQKGTTTVFQVFVGKDAPFPPDQPILYPAGFADGTSRTILVAEAAEAVPWTKPEDLTYDATQALPQLGGVRPDGFYVGMADGSTRFVHKSVSEKTIRAAITPAGNDEVGKDWDDSEIPLADPRRL